MAVTREQRLIEQVETDIIRFQAVANRIAEGHASTGTQRMALTVYAKECADEAKAALDNWGEWHEHYDDRIELADWLVHQCYFADQHAMLRFFQNPERYDREHGLYEAWNATKDRALWELITDALNDDRLSAEDVVAAHAESRANVEANN